MGGNANFSVASGTSQTIAGSIAESSASSITVTGGGTLVLSANNGGGDGFSGGTTVNDASTLSVAADNALGTSASSVALNNGTLQITGTTYNSTSRSITLGTGGGTIDIDNSANTFTVSQAMIGGGSLTKNGPGILLLTADNSFGGGTTISTGTLRVQSYGLPATSIVIDSSATLQYDTSVGNINQLRTDLSGTGELLKTGSGQLLFGNGGNNAINWNFSPGATIVVQQGTLVGGTSYSDNWTSNNASLNVASGAIFSGVEANVQIDALTGGGIFSGGYVGGSTETIGIAGGGGTFSGTLEDNSTPSGYFLNLVKTGAGTETLSGSNIYTGSTTVNNGTLATTATGTLGGGPLAVNAANGLTSAVNLGNNQTVSALSGTVAGTGSAQISAAAATLLTVSQTSNTTFGGTVQLAAGTTPGAGGGLAKSGSGKLEIDGGVALGTDSSLAVNGGTLRIDVASGSPNVGSGVTANISGSAVLELAGSVSELGTPTAADQAVIINDSTAAAGLLISSGTQQVGDIEGTGITQVDAGANLIAAQIVQGSLIIGVDSTVTIEPRGPDGMLAADSPLGDSQSTDDFLSVEPSGLLGGSSGNGRPAAVPEPGTIILLLVGCLCCAMSKVVSAFPRHEPGRFVAEVEAVEL